MSDSSRLKARDRIGQLVDEGSFVELDKYLERSNAVLGYKDVSVQGEGVVSGWATIDGRPVYVFAEDKDALKGSMSAAHGAKITKTMDMAAKNGVPVIGIWDSEGARVQEGAAVLNAYALIAKKLTDLSGVVPTISVAAGPMIGAAAVFSALSDFTVAIENISEIGVYGPMVLASSAEKPVDGEALIGAKVSESEAANAQFACATEAEAIETVKRLLMFLPSNNLEESQYIPTEDPANRAVTADAKDMAAFLKDIADDGEFLEVGAGYADDMITGFGFMNGFATGFIANKADGRITPRAAKKAARFMRFLDAYDMPVVTVIDNAGVPVCLPCAQDNQVRDLAQMVFAFANAGCPMVSLITGKAIGEGYAAMANKGLGADIVYAFPTAEISAVEKETGAMILFDNKSKADEFAAQFSTAEAAAKQGVVDDIIEPAETRAKLIGALDMASNKREQKLPKKHGVMPL